MTQQQDTTLSKSNEDIATKTKQIAPSGVSSKTTLHSTQQPEKDSMSIKSPIRTANFPIEAALQGGMDTAKSPLPQMISDSISGNDSLRMQKPIIGNEGKSHPPLPANEMWVFVALMILFALLAFNFRRFSALIADQTKSFFKKEDTIVRRFFSSINTLRFKSQFLLFSIGVFSLYVYILFYNPTDAFRLVTFLKILGVTSGFYLLKVLTVDFIGYVFFDTRKTKIFKDILFNLSTLLFIFVFALLIAKIYLLPIFDFPIDCVGIFLLVFFYILLFIKVFIIFYTKALGVFYIFLYLCTLEILPLLILFWVYHFIA